MAQQATFSVDMLDVQTTTDEWDDWSMDAFRAVERGQTAAAADLLTATDTASSVDRGGGARHRQDHSVVVCPRGLA